MMTIILSACLVSDPGTCRDFRLPIDGYWNTTQCAMYAPPFFARWSNQHPGWEIKRWRCDAGTFDDT